MNKTSYQGLVQMGKFKNENNDVYPDFNNQIVF